MDDYDFNNLKVILSKNPQELYVWWNSITEDDKSYAMELIQVYHNSIKEYQFEVLDNIEDVSAARDLLKQFML